MGFKLRYGSPPAIAVTRRTISVTKRRSFISLLLLWRCWANLNKWRHKSSFPSRECSLISILIKGRQQPRVPNLAWRSPVSLHWLLFWIIPGNCFWTLIWDWTSHWRWCRPHQQGKVSQRYSYIRQTRPPNFLDGLCLRSPWRSSLPGKLRFERSPLSWK